MAIAETVGRAQDDGLPVYGALREVVHLAETVEPLYVRYSEDPRADVGGRSMDGESGLTLPGLSASPLTPEQWWTRPVEQWVSRQLVKYRHLEREGEGRVAWILTGDEVGRGPDAEPLLADAIPVAVLAPRVLEEAETVYSASFERGQTVADARR